MKRTALTGCLGLVIVATLGCVQGMPPRSQVPSNASPHVRQGILALYSISAQSRARGCVALRTLGPRSAPAVPFLIPLLGDETIAWSPSIFIPYTGRAVANEAADALKLIGSPAVAPLIAALKDGNPAVRGRAAGCLGWIGDIRAVEPLLRAAADQDVHVQAAAKAALAGMPDPRAMPYAMSALNGEVNTAGRAIHALGEMGPAAREAVPALWTIFRDANHSNRWRAASALGKIEQGGPVVAALLEAAKDRSRNSHAYEAIGALGWMGPAARQAVPDLTRMLSEDRARCTAAVALWKITSDPSLCLPTLQAYAYYWESCQCLGDMGPAAAPAVPALAAALRDKQGSRRHAAAALGRIGPAAKQAVPALCECLKDSDSYGVREEAARALGRIGLEARSAIPRLRKLLRDDFLSVRIAAEDALEMLESSAQGTGKR